MLDRLLMAFRVFGLVAFLAVSTLGAAHAAPAQWSLDRASLGVDAKAAILNTPAEQRSIFLPGAYLSYSLTSVLSLAGTVERDFQGHMTLGRAGFRFALARVGDGGRLWGGLNVVGYGDEGAAGIVEPTSWEAVAQAAYPVVWASNGATLAWGLASATFDPENDLTTFRVGLRAQLIGGKP